jgi:hypothetical protein
VQLQIIPTTKGFFELVELEELDPAFEVALDELLEPQALRPSDATTSPQGTSARQWARRLPKSKILSS